VVPGGVTEPLDPASAIRFWPCFPRLTPTSAWPWRLQADRRPLPAGDSVFANFPVQLHEPDQRDESIEFTDGLLRLVDPQSKIIEDGINATHFTEVIGEAVEPYSYTKFVYYKPLGYPAASYRVGPWRALNIVKSMALRRRRRNSAAFKHWPRDRLKAPSTTITRGSLRRLYGIETMKTASCRSAILDKHVRATAGVNRLGRRGSDRGAARLAQPPLQGGRERQDHLGQPGGRTGHNTTP